MMSSALYAKPNIFHWKNFDDGSPAAHLESSCQFCFLPAVKLIKAFWESCWALVLCLFLPLWGWAPVGWKAPVNFTFCLQVKLASREASGIVFQGGHQVAEKFSISFGAQNTDLGDQIVKGAQHTQLLPLWAFPKIQTMTVILGTHFLRSWLQDLISKRIPDLRWSVVLGKKKHRPLPPNVNVLMMY